MNGHRILYFDLIRIVAAAMVVMIHVSGWPTSNGIVDSQRWDDVLFGALSACAVPLFFMISGALMLSEQYDFSTKKILSKVLKILIIWIVWNAAYAIAGMDHFSLGKLAVWTIKGHFHFWFFEYLIDIYLLLPVLRGLVEYDNGRYVVYFIVVWVIFGILKDTAAGLTWHAKDIRVITDKMHFELCDFSGYYVLGSWLARKDFRLNRYMWLVGYCFAAMAQFAIIRYCPLNVGTYSFTIAVALEAICMFMFCKCSDAMLGVGLPFLAFASPVTLGVYIMHPFVLEHCLPDVLFKLPPVLRMVVPSIYVLLFSAFATFLLTRVRFIRKWLLTI